jgi:hypothetical protein
VGYQDLQVRELEGEKVCRLVGSEVKSAPGPCGILVPIFLHMYFVIGIMER